MCSVRILLQTDNVEGSGKAARLSADSEITSEQRTKTGSVKKSRSYKNDSTRKTGRNVVGQKENDRGV